MLQRNPYCEKQTILFPAPSRHDVPIIGSAYLVVSIIHGQVAHGPPELLLHGRIAEMRRRDLLEQRKAALRYDRHLRQKGMEKKMSQQI